MNEKKKENFFLFTFYEESTNASWTDESISMRIILSVFFFLLFSSQLYNVLSYIYIYIYDAHRFDVSHESVNSMREK